MCGCLSDIEAYREFCKRIYVPLFARDSWLDAVCPGRWNVILVRKNGNVVAAMPYHEVRKFGLRFMLQPQLTQFLGPQIDYSGISADEYSRRLFFRECVDTILEQIERHRFAYQQISMHHDLTDWLPFYWKGYRSTLKYSYVIDDISVADNVYAGFSKSRKRDIKSAKAHGVVTDTSFSIEDFYEFHAKCVSMKSESLSYAREQLMKIYDMLSAEDRCLVIVSKDKDGNPLSAGFVVFDEKCAYLLMTANLRKGGTDGAFGCMIEKAVEYCSGITECFDFEGSMIKGAEQSYSKYGTSQKPYIFLEKYSSFFMEMLLRGSGKIK